jgi:predicted nucleic acid-binding protein
MKRLTLRGIGEDLNEELQQRAENWSCSLNAAILRILREATGQAKSKFRPEYHDLDDLAGSWTAEDKKEFEKVIEPLSRIDKDLWIAAAALQNGAGLYSLDGHFQTVDGLVLVPPI